MITIIEVEITNIIIEEHYYKFNYNIKINGKNQNNGKYINDHYWQNDKLGLKKILENGEAVKLVLEQEFS